MRHPGGLQSVENLGELPRLQYVCGAETSVEVGNTATRQSSSHHSKLKTRTHVGCASFISVTFSVSISSSLGTDTGGSNTWS
ncbi:hypothetical protein O3P69_006436 [Scylla paramamosain]|uniref:Uncharacterized protein n=1 Tax=Scylla paramamosain TaxID=85552 RepID=A0AAW0U632_SCYPA